MRDTDRILNTKAGPVLIRDGRYYSVNAFRSIKTGELIIEIRYELTRPDYFERHGLTPPEDTK